MGVTLGIIWHRILRARTPPPSLLGSSAQSAVWAADLGLSYAFADFINAHGGEDAVAEHYREQFTPRAKQPKPAFNLSAHSGRRERCDYPDRNCSKQTNRSRARLRDRRQCFTRKHHPEAR